MMPWQNNFIGAAQGPMQNMRNYSGNVIIGDPFDMLTPENPELQDDTDVFAQNDGLLSWEDHLYGYETNVVRYEEIWKDIIECYDYLAGSQYSQSQLSWYEKWDIIARSVNMVLPQIITVDGNNLQQSFGIRGIPIGRDDGAIAGKVTDIMQYLYRECRATDVASAVMMDSVVCGAGYLYSGWNPSHALYADGLLEKVRISPLDIIEDLDDGESDILRVNWRLFTQWYTPDGLIAIDAADDVSLAQEIDEQAGRLQGWEHRRRQRMRQFSVFSSYTGADYRVINQPKGILPEVYGKTPSDYADANKGRYRRLEYHYQRLVKRPRIVNPYNGKVIEAPREYANDPEALRLIADNMGIPREFVKQTQVPEWRQAVSYPGLIIGRVVRDQEYAVQGYNCAITRFSCYGYDVRRHKHKGVVHMVKDPQDRINTSMSLQEDSIRRARFPQVIAPDGAIGEETKRIQEWKSQAVGALKRYTWEPGMPEPKPWNTDASVALLNADMSINMKLMPLITGINPVLGGVKDAAKDGAELFNSMLQAGQLMLTPIVKNFKRSTREVARRDFRLAQTHMVMPRWVRVLGKNGAVDDQLSFMINEYDPAIRAAKFDLQTIQADVDIDETVQLPHQREESFSKMMKLIGLFSPMARELSMPELIELSGFANSDMLKRIYVLANNLQFGPAVMQALDEPNGIQKLLEMAATDPDLANHLMSSATNGKVPMPGMLPDAAPVGGGSRGGGPLPLPANDSPAADAPAAEVGV